MISLPDNSCLAAVFPQVSIGCLSEARETVFLAFVVTDNIWLSAFSNTRSGLYGTQSSGYSINYMRAIKDDRGELSNTFFFLPNLFVKKHQHYIMLSSLQVLTMRWRHIIKIIHTILQHSAT